MKKTAGLYPAPLKIMEVMRAGLEKGREEGYEAEAKVGCKACKPVKFLVEQCNCKYAVLCQTCLSQFFKLFRTLLYMIG